MSKDISINTNDLPEGFEKEKTQQPEEFIGTKKEQGLDKAPGEQAPAAKPAEDGSLETR